MIRACLALLALTLPISAQATTASHVPTHRVARPPVVDWTRTVVATPDGGFRMGNPAAKVKLVEFFSYTCPHCAAFATEAYGPLTDKYVRTGQVSLELRSALRDAIDFKMALATRCAPPQHYFGAVEAVMGSQQDWFPKVNDYIGAHRDELNAPHSTTAVHAMLASGGIDAMLAKQGVAPAALDKCLESKPAEDALQKTSNDAWNVRHIDGTPGFVINDQLQHNIFTWAELEPVLQAAIKG